MNSCSSSGMGFSFRPVDDELISYLIKFVSEDGYYCGYNEFELREVDEQEFERAKASVPSLEESLSKLSNILLQGSDDNDQSYFNLLPGLVPPITDDQSSQELPDLMSSADYGVELPHHDFELLEVEEQELERVKASVPLLEERLSELSNSLLQGSDN
ncbi:hypothetical protein HAX54_003062 [Datura stramonium]|uniref:NAC domain-containing protein n=1 Tax=Datura stramonium TaxID=4076 RepID=A0ABS8T4U9_DATST|nr:hypothetical protein [Datura stramonium]